MFPLMAQGLPLLAFGAVTMWVPDPMDKVLPDALAPPEPVLEIHVDAAANEYEGAQVALRAEGAEARLTAAVSDLVALDGARLPASDVDLFVVATVPLKHGTPGPDAGFFVARPPADMPDPMLPLAPDGFLLGQDRTASLYIRFHVRPGTPPGEYVGNLTVSDGGEPTAVPVRLTVWPVEVPAERHLMMTNWVNHYAFAEKHGVEPWSDAYFDIVGRYAREAAEHRQNMMWFPVHEIVVTRLEDGRLECDFARFDRWVEMCERYGVGDAIELTPLGHCDRESGAVPLSHWAVRNAATGEAESTPAEEVLPAVLPALERHLRERGWLDKTMLHIADEPFPINVAQYRATADWVHGLAPGIRLIEAIEAPDFGDSLDVWVPKLSHFNLWMEGYRAAQARGVEMWYYTCCHPWGPYPNRFLDQPLTAVRVLHWLNWRYDLPGYLHWGLNFWTADPLNDCGPPSLPPGDCWIVYPGPDGPVTSLRWEAMRDGIEDYELLWLLTERTRALLGELGAPEGAFTPSRRADEIAAAVVRTPVDWERDPAALRSFRRMVLEEIASLHAEPKVYVEAMPPVHQVLAPGPIYVVARGMAGPGVEVSANGQPASVLPDGTFVVGAFIAGEPELRVVARQGDRAKEVVRRWRMW